MLKQLDSHLISEGTNITADSFYSSQGRNDIDFIDDNNNLIENILEKYPTASTLEMETFQLFHLAEHSNRKIFTSAAAIVISNRWTGNVAGSHILDILEAESYISINICLLIPLC